MLIAFIIKQSGNEEKGAQGGPITKLITDVS